MAWHSAPTSSDRRRWRTTFLRSWREICPSPSQSNTSKAYWHMPSPRHLLVSTAAARNSVYSMAPLPLTSMPSRISSSSCSEMLRPLRRRPSCSSRGDSSPLPSKSSATNALRRARTSGSSSTPATTWRTAFENVSSDLNLRRFSTKPRGSPRAPGPAAAVSHSSARARAAVGLLSGLLVSKVCTNALACAGTRLQCAGKKQGIPLATLSSTLFSVLPVNGT
mmetsp:Transcript_100025/g.283146  ORF Transcript_100025/g.283146 Transcript_100025/m.283146 type:complete len:222 (+) Transcript_100025:321-986(+)